MSEWKEVRLGDVATLSTGFPFKGEKYSSKGIRVVRGDNVTIGELRWTADKDKRWNEEFDRTEEFSLRAEDIVIGMDGSRLGYNRAKIKNTDLPLLLAQRVACIRNNELSSQSFLYYQIFSKKFTKYIRNIQTGSAIPHVSLSQIGDFRFSLPPLPTQRAIASILSSFDDKIAINRKICANLEAQAQALFKHWFIDFAPFKDGKFVESELGMIPEGWKVGTLGEIAEITMGQSPSGSSYNEDGNGVIFYQGRTEFGFRFPSIRLFTTEPKRFADPLSTLLSVRAPVGDINVAIEKCCIGRGLASIKSKKEHHSFVYYLLKSLKRRFDVYNGEGTVFGSINKDTLNGMTVLIPAANIAKDFEDNAEELDKRILESFKENLHLSSLRDTLLPKLMSGEIKI